MIDFILEKTQQEVSQLITEAQEIFEKTPEFVKYHNLGEALASPDSKKRRIAATTVRVLENQRLFLENVKRTYGEATVVAKLGDLAPKILDVLRVAYPNSVANIICDVQPLDRLTGQIIIVRPRFGTTGGGVTAGQEIFANPTDGTYASSEFTVSVGTGNGTVKTFNKELGYKPIRGGTTKVLVDGVVAAVCNGSGTLTGANIDTGSTVNLSTGALTVVFISAPSNGAVITATFEADIESAEDNYLREIDLGIHIIPVRAKEHPLRLRWSEQARLVAYASTGVEINDVLTNVAGTFLKIERDRIAINIVRNAAGAYKSVLAFDCAVPGGGGITKREHFQDFLLKISVGSNLIFSNTGRGIVSWIIGGANASAVCENLNSFVREANAVPIGAHVVGYINGEIPVIKDNALPANEYIIGFNGSVVGDAGVIIADWIPIFFTPELVTPDLKGGRALLSMYDVVVNNSNYYHRGLISNF